MTEITILCRAVYDLWALVRNTEQKEFCAARGSFAASKYWTVFILLSAVLISIQAAPGRAPHQSLGEDRNTEIAEMHGSDALALPGRALRKTDFQIPQRHPAPRTDEASGQTSEGHPDGPQQGKRQQANEAEQAHREPARPVLRMKKMDVQPRNGS